MNLSDYFSKNGRGSAQALSRRIGAHAPDVSMWARKERPVPVARCIEIERATDGQVTRQELRPDDWHKIWPELVETTS